MAFIEPQARRDQVTMWSERLDDAIRADHPVRLFEAMMRSDAFARTLAELDRAEGTRVGAPSFAPSRLAMLLVYGQMMRVRSSRQLERACHDRLDVIWLMESLKPDHVTIARFFGRHKEVVDRLLKGSILVALDAGMTTLEMVAIDGTFIEANASRKSVKQEDEISKDLAAVEEQIRRMNEEFRENDEAEGRVAAVDGLMEPDTSLSPERQRTALESRRERLAAAKKRIEERRAEPRRPEDPDPQPAASTTDPEARHMKDKEGRTKPNFNAQLAVDGTAGLVVSVAVSDAPNDAGQMTGMLQRIEATCGRAPTSAALDAGYHSGREVAAAIDDPNTTVYVSDPQRKMYEASAESRAILASGGRLSLTQLAALPRNREDGFALACFSYDAATDTITCPAGEKMHPRGKKFRRDRFGAFGAFDYVTPACATCALRPQCTTSKEGRRICRSEYDAARDRMRERVMSEEGRAKARRRSATVEPRIGELKHNQGLRKLLRRGLSNALAEITLACVAMNILRLIRFKASRLAAAG